MTVNPYLGSDGVNPFIDVCKEEKKGSVHSGEDFQSVQRRVPGSADRRQTAL